MDQKLDDASYNEGRAAFATGASIRSIIEQLAAADTPADEVKTMSAAIGFADALLDLLRRAGGLNGR
jgi:hypothetical protein